VEGRTEGGEGRKYRGGENVTGFEGRGMTGCYKHSGEGQLNGGVYGRRMGNQRCKAPFEAVSIQWRTNSSCNGGFCVCVKRGPT